MGKLIFIANMSLDGYTTDKDGDFNWTEPNDEVFQFITDLIRPMHTHIYGRLMYETMMVWETDPRFAEESALMRDFAEVWQAADKIVYSRTLEKTSTHKTRIERIFDPDAIRQLKATSDHDIHIGGPDIASHAFRAGLIDEIHLFLFPIVVGGGKSALPNDMKIKLELLEERRFPNGTVYLRYQTGQRTAY